MSGRSGETAVNQSVKICKDFVHKYYHIFNTRPDLLYRLYSPNSRMRVSETVRGRNRNIEACASGQHEIRYLLTCFLERIHAKVINLSLKHSARDQLQLIVSGIFRHEVSHQDHFFKQTFVLASIQSGLAISSDVLQIFSHKLNLHLMNALQTNHESPKAQPTMIPSVVDRKIRSQVHRTRGEEFTSEVGSLFIVPTETLPSSTESDAMKSENSDTKKTRCIDTDTPREAGSEGFRTRGWDAFSKGKHVERPSDEILKPQTRIQYDNVEAFVDTPLTKKENRDKDEGPFLNCFADVKKRQEIKAEVNYPYSAKSPKNEPEHAGSYLRLFGFQPIPDGVPVEWDLTQDAVLTQLKTYQDVVDVFRVPVPKRRSRSMHSHVDWHHRTVYLDNLPVDVHPESLRKAFETTFGEIEEENGIIIASAIKSSIAYVVFKSLESAKAVGLADIWIKGSKMIIQKYQPPFPKIE